MQQALDAELSEDAAQELDAILRSDPSQAEEFDAQQRVDDLLRYPPHERAPQRLALTIMSRLAQTLRDQQTRHSALTEAQLQVAIQMVTVATLPLLVSAGYMLLNAQSDRRTLERVLTQVAGLLLIVNDVMTVMIEQAEALYQEDPELAVAMLSLIPNALLLLVNEILGIEPEGLADS
ncbi:MAG: anti-sigma factor family protein [Chloroflexota bacterium]